MRTPSRFSEDHPHPELKLATTLFRRVYAKATAGKVVDRAETIHVIEQIVSLRAQLDVKGFADVNVLEQRSVNECLPTAAKYVAAQVAELRPGGIGRKHGRNSRPERCRV